MHRDGGPPGAAAEAPAVARALLGGVLGALRRLLQAWARQPAWLRWSAPLGCMAVLWWSSAQQPRLREPDLVRALLHNGAHGVAYAVLATAFWLAQGPVAPPRSAQRALRSAALAIAYGIVDELHQASVPGRVCSLADVLTDACGAAFAVTWLRDQLGGERAARRWLLGLGLGCLASVGLATFGPW